MFLPVEEPRENTHHLRRLLPGTAVGRSLFRRREHGRQRLDRVAPARRRQLERGRIRQRQIRRDRLRQHEHRRHVRRKKLVARAKHSGRQTMESPGLRQWPLCRGRPGIGRGHLVHRRPGLVAGRAQRVFQLEFDCLGLGKIRGHLFDNGPGRPVRRWNELENGESVQ